MKEEDNEESPQTFHDIRASNNKKHSHDIDEGEEYNSEEQSPGDSHPNQEFRDDEKDPEEQQKDFSESDHEQPEAEGNTEGEGEGDEQSEQIPLLFVDVNLGRLSKQLSV